MSTVEQTIPTGTWKLDPIHSTVGFSVRHLGVSTFRGSFRDFDAQLSYGEDGPRLAGTARVDSVDVRDENLNAHLLSPDFFDAERNPEIRFEATRVSADGGDVTVEGDLTIKGITRPVTARGNITEPGADMAGGQRIGVGLETVVDRKEFGLEWNADLPGGGVAVGDEVTLSVHLELVKEA